ncbi:hypothetical protein [Pedobacter sp. Leaf170]|uniref:hypothetical protein n=1 Tax=Pedobacter sp. Leaf170 TaxID=2876558 RepID=UPI001E5E5298|nr:hypothetical protein [Pedobacter sp. Leaf170]
MKKLLSIALLMTCFISFAKAQKGRETGVFINPDRKIVQIKPDLSILLIPGLTNGGTEAIYQPATVETKNKTKIPKNLIIKNIGLATSKPCKVILYVHFQAPRTFSEVEHGVAEGAFNDAAISDPLPLPALTQGQDLGKEHSFVFNTFPNLSPGKKVRLTAIIIYPTPAAEASTDNNTSRKFEVGLVTRL